MINLFNKFNITKLFTIIAIPLCFFRLFYCFSYGDECLNISLALSIANGSRPFFDMYELYQTGAIILSPFIKLFHLFSNTNDALILYCRIVYFILNLILCGVTYFIFRKAINKSYALLIGVIFVCFAPYSLYYLWYDTVYIYFSILGTVLLIGSFYLKNNIVKFFLSLFAGFSHAIMSLGYPTMIFVALLFFVLIFFKYKKLSLYYAMGGHYCSYFYSVHIK